MSDDYINRIERFLDEIDCSYRFEKRAKHRSVIVTHNGRQFFYVFPLSGSTRRGPPQTVSGLRRALLNGVAR